MRGDDNNNSLYPIHYTYNSTFSIRCTRVLHCFADDMVEIVLIVVAVAGWLYVGYIPIVVLSLSASHLDSQIIWWWARGWREGSVDDWMRSIYFCCELYFIAYKYDHRIR